MTSKVLTANRLIDGVSVWMGASGQWVETLGEAFIARHDEAAAALETAGKQAQADNSVVDANVIDVEETATGIRALRLRERIRADGPSIDYLATRSSASANRAA